jgi:isopenicillin N synthase-like dioxygenase
LKMDDTDWFRTALDLNQDDSFSTLRYIHYPDTHGKAPPPGHWRAGYDYIRNVADKSAHTDLSVLTILFQRPGQNGLEICPGRDALTVHANGDDWTPIIFPNKTTIVCNIGDGLMRISSDRFHSTFHRVRPNAEGECGERYSIAWFNQPNRGNVMIDVGGKYPPILAEDFMFDAIKKKYYTGRKD